MSDQAVYTILGWIVVIGAGGYAYYYYQNANKNRRAFRGRTNRAPSTVSEYDARPSRARRRDERRDTSDAPSSDGSNAKGRVRKPKPVKSTTGSRFEALQLNEPEEEDEKDDLGFAEALQKSRKGTTFASSGRQDSRQRTVKQANANKRNEPSATSSTTGGEADDDLSPAVSPALNATTGGHLPNGNDVSDMLGPSRGGPSILNITPSQKLERPKTNQQHKPAQEQETKKQRQNRKKKEEQQAQRQEAEQQRKKMEEAQRRTAREARGEPSKNGVMSANVSAANPWNGVSHANSVPKPLTSGPLLDTFTPDNASTSSSNVPHSAASNSTGDSNWEAGLPDEDEQLRRIMEQDESAWHTVPVGGKRGKKKQAAKPGADTTETEYSESDAKVNLAVKKPEEKANLAVKKPEDGKGNLAVDKPKDARSKAHSQQDIGVEICDLTW
jgi:hypothetical protein